jgi:bacterioferritin (cytochrome b1)
MSFNVALQELHRHIGETLSALERSSKTAKQEGIEDKTVTDALEVANRELSQLRDSITRIVAENEGAFEMIGFLNEALRMEYRHIISYERYADVVTDARLADTLRTFGAEERQHAHALSMKIMELGGSPHFSGEHEVRDDMTVLDLINLHLQTEKELMETYERGMQKFDDPGFRWLIGKIKVEEAYHIQRLTRLREKHRGDAVMIEESKSKKWVDPYMGKPGDRAWIE